MRRRRKAWEIKTMRKREQNNNERENKKTEKRIARSQNMIELKRKQETKRTIRSSYVYGDQQTDTDINTCIHTTRMQQKYTCIHGKSY